MLAIFAMYLAASSFARAPHRGLFGCWSSLAWQPLKRKCVGIANGHIDRHSSSEPCGDLRSAWASEVAAGRMVLGLKDWMAARAMQAAQNA